MKQKTSFKIFENIGYWYRLPVHEWPIYPHRYRPQKSHIGRSLLHMVDFLKVTTKPGGKP